MLRKLFNYIHSKLTICEIYTFQGTREDIEDVLKQLLPTSKYGFGTNYNVYNGSRQYYMTSNWSWGMLRLTGVGGMPIKIYFEYSALDAREQEIKIFTTVRPENLFLLFMMIMLGIIVKATEASYSILFLSPSLFIIMFFVSNFFYKLQEQALIKDVRKTIGLKFVSKH
jgi:hypothetical protein